MGLELHLKTLLLLQFYPISAKLYEDITYHGGIEPYYFS